MISVKVVPAEHIPSVWPLVKPWLVSALEYAQGDYSIEHLEAFLTSGQWMLLIAQDETGEIKGAAALQFFNRPTSRIAFVIAIGGKLISCRDSFSQLSEICKAYGATHIEGAARESIARLWRRFNFEEKYRIVGVKL